MSAHNLPDVSCQCNHCKLMCVSSPCFPTPEEVIRLRDAGLCQLHDQGLKPLEGRKAHHNRADGGLRGSVCRTWWNRRGEKVLEQFVDDDDDRKAAVGIVQVLAEYKEQIHFERFQ